MHTINYFLFKMVWCDLVLFAYQKLFSFLLNTCSFVQFNNNKCTLVFQSKSQNQLYIAVYFTLSCSRSRIIKQFSNSLIGNSKQNNNILPYFIYASNLKAHKFVLWVFVTRSINSSYLLIYCCFTFTNL